MADKKKKVFISKDLPPRRPMILKSDRDTTKESPSKEKPEKEIQPMILLKPRETSTPKENRPSSPKNVLESEVQPNKIAQNESKEKKVVEQKPPHSVIKMKETVKLLDENLEINNSALEFLQDVSSNYLVVGIMGTQGVGKSMILNLISNDKPVEDLCERILNSHEISLIEDATTEDQTENLSLDDDKSTKKHDVSNFFKFKMQDMEQIERGTYCTKGIDMYITDDRVIFLDCQPLWSPSLLEDNAGITAPLANTYSSVIIDYLQISSFLMAISHVLIVVQDWFTDYNFLRYIQTAEMLRPTLSTSYSQNNPDLGEMDSPCENNPHILLLHNRCQLEDFTPENVRYMQNIYRKVFKQSNLQLNSGLYLYSDTNKNGNNIDNICQAYSVEKCGMPLNLFLLPEIYEDIDNKDIYRGHPAFEKLTQRLRWMILGVHRHQISSTAHLSEKNWFHHCNKAWEAIKKCSFFIEYERFLP